MRAAQNLSVFRYPGSKARLIPYIQQFMEKNYLMGGHICEPFSGSGIVSLWLLKNLLVTRVTLVEKDPLVYACLKSIKDRPDELIDLIKRNPIDIKTWEYISKMCHKDLKNYKLEEIGFAGLFLNRVNYSGVLGATPIGGRNQTSKYKIDCRFNKKSVIDKIAALTEVMAQVKIIQGDGIDALKSSFCVQEDISFYYIDPPYFGYGHKFYRFSYDIFEHKRLRDVAATLETSWILSYDDVEPIRNLYSRFNCIEVSWLNSARLSRMGREVLFSNEILPKIDNFLSHGSLSKEDQPSAASESAASELEASPPEKR